MFTGIITDIGTIAGQIDGSFQISASYPAADIAIGASIACDGVCLTVTKIEARPEGCLFSVDVSNETRSKTTIGQWTPGHRINLERALALGDEMGGHVVTGHVDGVARIVDCQDDDVSRRFSFEVPEHLAIYIAPKGSVALDGTSLTVNEVSGGRFGVNVIPHTLTVTTWGAKSAGENVNLEVDVFARYVARMMEFRN